MLTDWKIAIKNLELLNKVNNILHRNVCVWRYLQAAGARIRNTSAARTAGPLRRDRTLPDAPAKLRNTDAVRMESRKLKERTLRVVLRYRPCPVLRAVWRRTGAPAETSQSSGSTIPITAVARDSGTEDARVTRIDSKRRKSAKRFAFSQKEKVVIQRRPFAIINYI